MPVITESTVTINAPAERIWTMLEDFSQWGEWNPLYVQTSGRLVPGETIHATVQLAGMKPQNAVATVTAVHPEQVIRYEIRELGGLVKVTRDIELSRQGTNSCLVTNRETMRGPAGEIIGRLMTRKVKAGLDAMNGALKQRCEAACT